MAGWPYTRPLPPQHLRRPGLGFARAEELEHFVRAEFVSRGGIFFDREHEHLQRATVGILWAASVHVDKGSVKAGTAQLVKRGEPRKWSDAVVACFLHEHFGPNLPTFRITLSAPICAEYDDREFFALVDHELSHCGVARCPHSGAPLFSEATGETIWKGRPHDAETFEGTTERWGAAASGSAGVVAAALKRPRFGWVPGRDLDIHKACGTP
jgi:hypothetical protein